MSGPVNDPRDSAMSVVDEPTDCEVEIVEGRTARVGAISVNRLLPRRARRMVGAWCFLDHMLPATVDDSVGLDVGPHPHIGLQTVTWLFSGEVLHRDSLGSEQLIRPGQLNLMTAGRGVSHSEETRGVFSGKIHGIQLWVAQPESTRDRPAAFEHHGELPIVDLGAGEATVLVGTLAGVSSVARADTDHVGAELTMGTGACSLPLQPDHEYGIVVIDGAVSVRGTHLQPGRLGYLGIGHDELTLNTTGNARALLVGGAPFSEEVLMWWNYVARTRDEITRAHDEWTVAGDRFGTVNSALERVVVDAPPWN